jgi:DNA-binding winged helix-turn-helix (wHTH) protein
LEFVMSDHSLPSPSTARLVRFGTFVLDREQRQLFDGDQQVHLSPKAYQLLDLFLVSRPRALSKSDLHNHLWPATFVSEANLASLVAELRAALGDDRHGRVIRTVHAFGYAFVAETSEVPARTETVDGSCVQWLARASHQLPLHEGEQIVGRDTLADIVLDSLSVSRRHAIIMVAGANVTVEDLGSKNGTWRRGLRLTGPTSLEDGDEVRFGSVDVVFRTTVAPAATRTDNG